MRKIFSALTVLVVSLFFLSTGQMYADGLKVFISVDMEGVAGVVHGDHVSAGGRDYSMARRWTTAEANAAIEGALAAGATEIVVNDSHGGMRNIIASELNPAARLITGSPKPFSMMQGIDETFDAVILIGYHARAGSIDGVLDHTYSGASVYSVKVNGVELGESEMNALVAGYYGVPVVMIAGDEEACRQARGTLGDQLVTAEVKIGIGRYAANTLVPSVAQELIKEKTQVALERLSGMKVFNLNAPYRFDVDFLRSDQAQGAELVPGVERSGPRSVTFTMDDFVDGFQMFRALLVLAR